MNILTNKKAVRVSGNDATSFLQGQMSNDIAKIDERTAQLNALCQHQGKIIALLTIIKKDDNFYLIMLESMVETVVNRLSLFIIMSDVTLEVSEYHVIGQINENNGHKLTEALSYTLSDSNEYNAEKNWSEICIAHNIPEVYPQTSEKFVPQMLNLDIDEFGVNFSKGCYTGQEVVARLHYLGKAKRRLFSFKSEAEIHIGDELIVENSQSAKASGIVVDVVKLTDFYHFIATLEVDKTAEKITINNTQIHLNE